MELFGLVYLYQQLYNNIVPLIFLILYPFGIHKFNTQSQIIINNIRKNIYVSTEQHEGLDCGYLIGKYFTGYLTSSNNGIYVTIICTAQQYELLQVSKTTHTFDDPSKNCKDAPISKYKFYDFERSITLGASFNKTIKDIPDLTPRKSQQEIMDKIIDQYEKHKFCTAIIGGKTGSGKSTIGYLLARHFMKCGHVSHTNEFDLSVPMTTFGQLYQQMTSTRSDVCIIVFDEFDRLIYNLHHEKIEKYHKKLMAPVYDKISWNGFLDRIAMGFFPYVIILFTTNQSLDYCDNLDPSYTRDGRINFKFTL